MRVTLMTHMMRTTSRVTTKLEVKYLLLPIGSFGTEQVFQMTRPQEPEKKFSSVFN